MKLQLWHRDGNTTFQTNNIFASALNEIEGFLELNVCHWKKHSCCLFRL